MARLRSLDGLPARQFSCPQSLHAAPRTSGCEQGTVTHADSLSSRSLQWRRRLNIIAWLHIGSEGRRLLGVGLAQENLKGARVHGGLSVPFETARDWLDFKLISTHRFRESPSHWHGQCTASESDSDPAYGSYAAAPRRLRHIRPHLWSRQAESLTRKQALSFRVDALAFF
jgi:hypothetical protein